MSTELECFLPSKDVNEYKIKIGNTDTESDDNESLPFNKQNPSMSHSPSSQQSPKLHTKRTLSGEVRFFFPPYPLRNAEILTDYNHTPHRAQSLEWTMSTTDVFMSFLFSTAGPRIVFTKWNAVLWTIRSSSELSFSEANLCS